MDLNPVRARLTQSAVDYRWSSARAHVDGRDPSGLLDMEGEGDSRLVFSFGDIVAEAWGI